MAKQKQKLNVWSSFLVDPRRIRIVRLLSLSQRLLFNALSYRPEIRKKHKNLFSFSLCRCFYIFWQLQRDVEASIVSVSDEISCRKHFRGSSPGRTSEPRAGLEQSSVEKKLLQCVCLIPRRILFFPLR